MRSVSSGILSFPLVPVPLRTQKKAVVPDRIPPMLAILEKDPFDDKEFIFEVKWDGYRAIADKRGDKVRLTSRDGICCNEKFFSMVDILSKIPGDFVLDGELVGIGENGQPGFAHLQEYLHKRGGILHYKIFDILFLNGLDLRPLPLIRRKAILKKILPNHPSLHYVEHVEKNGKAFFEMVLAQGIEGMMAKQKWSTYQTGVRSQDWRKVKTGYRQEAVICGYTKKKGKKDELESLLVGVYHHGALTFAGPVMIREDQIILKKTLESLETKSSPFLERPMIPRALHFISPELVGEIRFTGWTPDGWMRHPYFLGLREDKNPKEVVREKCLKKKKPTEPELLEREECSASPAIMNQIMTDPDKIFWPEDRYTKKELVEYYESVAPVMLPYLKNRPQLLHRFIHGIDGESFYQKDVAGLVPSWVKTAKYYEESGSHELTYLVCQDAQTLLYMANLGCIEINPWNSQNMKPDYPDYLILDLDPDGVLFSDVVTVALKVHEILSAGNIPHFVKTSGGRGLHIGIPMGAKYHFEQVKEFAFVISSMVNRELPELTTVERDLDKRKGKVTLNYLKNRRGQTTAAPYCVRPRRGAPVSTPLSWDEVTSDLNPLAFTMKNITARLTEKGDLWKGVMGAGIVLEDTLKALDKVMKRGLGA